MPPEEACPVFSEEVFFSLLLVLVITSGNTFAPEHHLSPRIGLQQKGYQSELNSSHLVCDPVVALLPIHKTDLHAGHWASYDPHAHISRHLSHQLKMVWRLIYNVLRIFCNSSCFDGLFHNILSTLVIQDLRANIDFENSQP